MIGVIKFYTVLVAIPEKRDHKVPCIYMDQWPLLRRTS